MVRRISIVLVLCLAVVSFPRHVCAQAVQAVRSLDGIHQREKVQRHADTLQVMLDRISAHRRDLEANLSRDREKLAEAARRNEDTTPMQRAVTMDSAKLAEMTSPAMLAFERNARAAIEARGDAKEFDARLKALSSDLVLNAPALTSAGFDSDRTIEMMTADDAPFEVIPHLAFVAGLDWTGSSGTIGTAGLGVYTNLMGEAIAPAIGAVSSDKFKNYVADHTSIGTSFALSKRGRPSGQLGLGLGRLNTGRGDIWASLNFEQFDSRDPRVPTSVTGTKPEQGAWSTPTLSVTFSPFSPAIMRDRISRAKVVPFINVGIGAPHYYPGNLFESMGALFTENRKNYVQTAHPRFTAALSIPIMPFASRPESKDQ